MFIYYKESSVFRYHVSVYDGMFYTPVETVSTNTWLHVAIVYRGPNDGEGLTVYHDGVYMGNDTTKWSYNCTGTGTVKIGRRYDEPGYAYYGSAYVDELLFFNYQLSPSQINMTKNAD